MSKKTILWILGTLMLVGVVVTVILVGGPSNLFQGAIYNLRPIYTDCRIEGANFNSTTLDHCEHFNDHFKAKYFPDGEYTIFTKYADKKLADNIIPIKIQGDKLECNYLNNGYQPVVRVFDPTSPITSASVTANESVPVGSPGLVVELNYQKTGDQYFYDTNICESAFLGTLSDSTNQALGTAKLDFNGFINSRPLVNQILIIDAPYYQTSSGLSVKTLQPGNTMLSLNAAPEITFKLTVPCSNFVPEAKVPNIETSTTIPVSISGINQDYFNNCGGRLYFSFQNTNRYDDIQKMENIAWNYADGTLSFELNPDQLGRVLDPNTVFPISFRMNLHLRDRSDSKEVYTLGSGVLTVTGHKKAKVKPNPDSQNTAIIQDQNATANSAQAPASIIFTDSEAPAPNVPTIIDTESAPESVDMTPPVEAAPAADIPEEKAKVRYSAEPVLVNPEIPGEVPEENPEALAAT